MTAALSSARIAAAVAAWGDNSLVMINSPIRFQVTPGRILYLCLLLYVYDYTLFVSCVNINQTVRAIYF